jgi:hypothetical protein
LILNSAQIAGIPQALTGVRLTGATGEAHNARCASPGEEPPNLSGQIFRYEKMELKRAEALIATIGGEPLVTVNKVGKGQVVFCAVPDLLGEDDRMTPFAAHMLAHVFADATPVRVRGDVEYLVNRTDVGWVITLFNNNGVTKYQQGMAQVDRNARVSAQLSLGEKGIGNAAEWTLDRSLEVTRRAGEPDSVTVEIPSGGIAIVELKSRN